MLLSTLYIMWPIQLTKFAVATSKGLGGEAFTRKFNIWPLILSLGVKAIQIFAQYPLHHVTYSATKFEVATSNRLGGDTFTRKYIIWPLTLTLVKWNVAQYHLHHLTYSTTKFEVATSNGLGGDTFTRNSTDGRTHGRTDRRTDGWTTDRLWHEINIPFFLKKKTYIINQ